MHATIGLFKIAPKDSVIYEISAEANPISNKGFSA